MKWRKHKEQKRKPKKFVKLLLGKDGERKELTLKLGSTWNLAKKIKPLIKFAKDGWKILEVSGNDPAKVAFIQKIADGYRPGAKDLMRQTGFKEIPGRVKKFFGKDGELKD